MSRRFPDLVALGALPCLALGVFLAYPSRQYHWDVLERAYLLEHPARYLHSWDGSPRSLFLSFAHLLELPLAAILRSIAPRLSGLQALCILEAVLAAAALVVLGWLVQRWRAWTGMDRGACWALDRWPVWFAQLTLAVTIAFWKLGSSGQEKMLALATQLLFLAVFWRALATATDSTAARPRPVPVRAGVDWSIAATLALAIWSHLTGAVLVPFAVLALFALPQAWRLQRGRVARGVIVGTLLAGVVYWLVAAWTTSARGPASFIDYLTFFHRSGGNSFWEPGGAPSTVGSRWARAATGMAAFLSGNTAVGAGALILLVFGIAIWGWRGRAGRRAARRPGTPTLTTMRHQALIVAGLWTVHFAFFEPQNFESWTLFVTLVILMAAVSMPAVRLAWLAAVLPAILVVANRPHYVANHRPLQLQGYREAVSRETRPGDIVVLVGGIQNGRELRGGIVMRYFLATLRERTLVSLYDVMGLTEREYWERPFESPAALQAAIDSGRRAVLPRHLIQEWELARQSGLLSFDGIARNDSVVEIHHIAGP
jgi:hypothetical protein